MRHREVRNTEPATSGKKVTAQQDATGGCDGIKNGKWVFHTENEDRPWWQIDLGKSIPLDRMFFYNRCVIAERNSRLMVLLSDDAKNFRQVYQHNGTTFYDIERLSTRIDIYAQLQGSFIEHQEKNFSHFEIILQPF